MNLQTNYQNALRFAGLKHAEKNQTIPSSKLPYSVHLSNVSMEILVAAYHTEAFNLSFAVLLALLHDTLEDTQTSFEEIEENFGKQVADGVLALTKNHKLPKNEQMLDSLHRIKLLPKEVGMVKLADRITNLQAPPAHWDNEKIKKYREEAILILNELRYADAYLANRLEILIEDYKKYLV